MWIASDCQIPIPLLCKSGLKDGIYLFKLLKNDLHGIFGLARSLFCNIFSSVSVFLSKNPKPSIINRNFESVSSNII